MACLRPLWQFHAFSTDLVHGQPLAERPSRTARPARPRAQSCSSSQGSWRRNSGQCSGPVSARTDFDWCSKCGGRAIRGLTDSQLSYYRAAHRLHGIKRPLCGTSGTPDTDISTVVTRLAELAVWQPVDEQRWCGSDSWQWQGTIRELSRKTERSHAVTGSGDPAS